MNEQKLDFLRTSLMQLVEKLNPLQKPLWGNMNTQQMVEHLAGLFQISIDKRYYPLLTPEEKLPVFKEFVMSEKQFKENTKAPMLPEDPLPLIHTAFDDVLTSLKKEITDFVSFFKNYPDKKTQHPVFGNLNFEEWVQLHHKHAMHHLKQFGVELK